jgi:hypothetical protein
MIIKESGKKILLILGWIFVIWAFLSGSFIFGLFSASIGFVLKKDYNERSLGLTLIIMGIISGLSGIVFSNLSVWYVDNYF